MKLRLAIHLLVLSAVVALSIGITSSAHAAYLLTLQETAGNVVATGSGSFNLAALTVNSLNNVGFGAQVEAKFGEAYIGAPAGQNADLYQSISGPSNFGSGDLFLPSSGGGSLVGVLGIAGFLLVPAGYTSGTILSGSDTWNTATLSSLGITPGTYTYSWGSGGTADSFIIHANTAVPEPSTWVALLAGVGICLGFRRRRAV